MINLNKFQDANLDVRTNVYLKDYLSLKIGGLADYFIEVRSEEDIIKAIKLSEEMNLKYFVIGNGSNTLALEYGVRGVVIYLGPKYSKITLLEDNIIKAEAGALLKDVCLFARDNSLSGMEALYGIPASVGGAIYMNAGAYNGEMKDVTSHVEYINKDVTAITLSNEDSEFSYRNSYYMHNEGVVSAAYFKLHDDNKDSISDRMADFLHRRESKQPLEYPSAGSTFKRPKNHYASALIDQCNLKGFEINGIKVSEKHAGFLINVNGGSSDDFISLINHIQARVYVLTGFVLEPEIQILK